jgi:hypothetical protein
LLQLKRPGIIIRVIILKNPLIQVLSIILLSFILSVVHYHIIIICTYHLDVLASTHWILHNHPWWEIWVAACSVELLAEHKLLILIRSPHTHIRASLDYLALGCSFSSHLALS